MIQIGHILILNSFKIFIYLKLGIIDYIKIFTAQLVFNLKCIMHNVRKAAHYLVGRMFANGPGDVGSIPGRVI